MHRGELIRLVEVLDEEVLVERAVVVEIVAAGVAAAVVRKVLVAGALLDHVEVALDAEVARDGDAGPRSLGHVLAVAGHARARVEARGALGVARIGELDVGVRVAFGGERGAVAPAARVVLHAAKGRVALLAGDLDLVMAVRGLPGQVGELVAFAEERSAVVAPEGGGEQQEADHRDACAHARGSPASVVVGAQDMQGEEDGKRQEEHEVSAVPH